MGSREDTRAARTRPKPATGWYIGIVYRICALLVTVRLPDKLAIFPLGVVLYPGDELPLHIFEPRYRELVHDCRTADEPFGVVLFQDGHLAEIGCTARIVEIVRSYEDGRLDILTKGEHPFRLGETVHDRSYLRAPAESQPDFWTHPQPVMRLRERLITQHIRLLEMAGRTPSPVVYQGKTLVSYFVAHNSGLSLAQQQEVLATRTELGRLQLLVTHLEGFIPRVEHAEGLRKKVSSNGHFPDFPPTQS